MRVLLVIEFGMDPGMVLVLAAVGAMLGGAFGCTLYGFIQIRLQRARRSRQA
jgi:hypothetical protein